MERVEIDARLTAIESALEADPTASLGGRGFWAAVDAVKRDPDLVDPFADRIASLDRQGFERWALLTVPAGIGTMVALIVAALGLTMVGLAYSTEEPWNGLLLLGGMFVTFVATHGIGHVLVGRFVGIRFSHWYVGTIGRPQPGVKTDYASYLRASPRGRAWMHASGAIVSKLVPFLLVPAGLIAGVPWWATTLLVLFGVTGIVTDRLLSVTKSDWKKYLRERRIAEELTAE